METTKSSLSDPQIFTVQFDPRIPLTPDQVNAIEHAIQTTVAEQIAMLSIAATSRPFDKPEGLPDPLNPFKNRVGAYAILTEPPEVLG